MLRFAIKIICPIRLERIRNGEKIIVQTGPDEHEVEVQWDDEAENFQSQGSQTARAKNHCFNASAVVFLRLNAPNRRFMSRTKWRAPHTSDQDETGRLNASPEVETHYIPPLTLTFSVVWRLIANGERIIEDVLVPGRSGRWPSDSVIPRALRRRE